MTIPASDITYQHLATLLLDGFSAKLRANDVSFDPSLATAKVWQVVNFTITTEGNLSFQLSRNIDGGDKPEIMTFEAKPNDYINDRFIYEYADTSTDNGLWRHHLLRIEHELPYLPVCDVKEIDLPRVPGSVWASFESYYSKCNAAEYKILGDQFFDARLALSSSPSLSTLKSVVAARRAYFDFYENGQTW